jgi:hypothetical protein
VEDDTIAPDRQTLVNTVINAGTSAGIILSVPVLFYAGEAGVRPASSLPFCTVLPAGSVRYLPGRTTRSENNCHPGAGLRKPGMYRLA